MTRIGIVVACVAALAGCNKPTEDSCRKALANMRVLIGAENPTGDKSDAGDVRRCRGSSTRKAVKCASDATTVDELNKCAFMGKHTFLTAPAPAPAPAPTPAPAPAK